MHPCLPRRPDWAEAPSDPDFVPGGIRERATQRGPTGDDTARRLRSRSYWMQDASAHVLTYRRYKMAVAKSFTL
jgi:hypothetical protein